MKTKQKYDLVKQWKRNRLSLIAIIAFTVINIFIFILQVLGINFKFFSPYSIYLTHFMMQVGYSKSELSGVYMNFMYSVIASMVLVGIFVFLYFWAFKNPKAYLVAFILFLIDTAFIFFVFFRYDEQTLFVDFLFHLWALYSLIIAYSTGQQLKYNYIELNKNIWRNDDVKS